MTCRNYNHGVVLIHGGNIAIAESITHMLSAMDNVVVVVIEQQEPVSINLNNFGCIGEILPIKNEHGSYRQFEKRDKRKNFRKLKR